MARFYGTVQGNRGRATRLGHSQLRVSAQSFEGSIIVELFAGREGEKDCVRISLAHGSSASHEHILFDDTIEALWATKHILERVAR